MNSELSKQILSAPATVVCLRCYTVREIEFESARHLRPGPCDCCGDVGWARLDDLPRTLAVRGQKRRPRG